MSKPIITLSSDQIRRVTGGKTPVTQTTTTGKKKQPQEFIGGEPTMGLAKCILDKVGIKVPENPNIRFKSGTDLSCKTHEKIGDIMERFAD